MLGQNCNLLTLLKKLALMMLMVCMAASLASGQDPGGGDDGGGDDGEAAAPQVGGIIINADGLIEARKIPADSRLLNQQRFAAAKAALNQDLQKPSLLRKISLTRLESAAAKLIAAGKPVPANMQYLAGMTKITHVFYYPEAKDIVIAGPAEGFFYNADNFVVGMDTGQATLKLEDLVVALRAFAPNQNQTSVITCSIDPTQEGLVRYQKALNDIQRSGQFNRGAENQVVDIYKKALGPQTITVTGISPNTDFARVLVEADYRMKMVGLGLMRPAAPKVTSYISKVRPGASANAARWYFQPDYNCVAINDDETAMELIGDGVKLVGEDEINMAGGQRKGKGKASMASRAFTTSFTKQYPQMAKNAPIWAELRNVIDMSVAAAFIQKMDLYNKAGWSLGVFGDESQFVTEKYEAPKQVAPVANAFWKGNQFMALVAGGVSIQAKVALNSDRVTVDQEGKINQVRDNIDLSGLDPDQWWWD